jgi:coproporphyrinogen III oxidase-like Fe-S oxidoreductase
MGGCRRGLLPLLVLTQARGAAQVALAPTHLSVYDLIVEQGTAFGAWYARAAGPPGGRAPLPGDALAGDMYREAARALADAGFEHYEVLPRARPCPAR